MKRLTLGENVMTIENMKKPLIGYFKKLNIRIDIFLGMNIELNGIRMKLFPNRNFIIGILIFTDPDIIGFRMVLPWEIAKSHFVKLV